MTRIINAELQRLLRRRTVIVAAGRRVGLRASSPRSPCSSSRSTATTVGLAAGRRHARRAHGHGGGTEAFAVGASFAGFLVFVTFIALDRHRVLRRHVPGAAPARPAPAPSDRRQARRHPRRRRRRRRGLAEVVTFLLVDSLVAPAKDIATSDWFSLASLGHGLRDYATVFAGVAGWAIFGTTLAVIFRSAPLALGVGFAWAGPFENIVVDSWNTGYRVFPGQVLGSLIREARPSSRWEERSRTALVYTAVAAGVRLALVARRDVTS